MNDTTIVADQPGKIGRFPLHKRVGKGGMGEVYRAWHPSLKVDVALKTILPKYSDNPYFQRKLLEEGEKQAQLRHPNILRMLDSDEVDGQWFLVTEYAEGGTLRDRIREGLSAKAGLADLRKIAHALAHAHTRPEPVVHLDIKPENILYVDDEPKLADFGIARIAEGGEVDSTRVAFDPRYSPPEQLEGHPSPASDVYALGLMLRELVAGIAPKERRSARLSAKEISEELPDRIRGALADLVGRCTAQDPALRPTAPELVETLDSLLEAKRSVSKWALVLVVGTGLAIGALLPDVREWSLAAYRSIFPPASQQVEFAVQPAQARIWGGEWLERSTRLDRGSHKIAITAPGFIGRVIDLEVPLDELRVTVVLDPRPDTIDLEYLTFQEMSARERDAELFAIDWQDPALKAAATVLAAPEPGIRSETLANLNVLALANDVVAAAALYLHASLSGREITSELTRHLRRAAHTDDALTALMYAEHCSALALTAVAAEEVASHRRCAVEYLKKAGRFGMTDTVGKLTASHSGSTISNSSRTP